MNEQGYANELTSLNRAFQRAFDHAANRGTLSDLLQYMGEELSCDRISIFEINQDGTCDNTYEWCSRSQDHVNELLHAIPSGTFDSLMQCLKGQDHLLVRDMDQAEHMVGEAAELLREQGIHSFVGSRIAFQGMELGFFLMENPSEEILRDAAIIIPGMRYILSSLVYNDHLIRRLQAVGFRDHLTGTGNLTSLKEKLEHWRNHAPIGMIYLEVSGWHDQNAAGGIFGLEQAMVRTGDVLTGLYGDNAVFRIAPTEFLVLQDTPRHAFEKSIFILRQLMKEHELSCGIGSVYEPEAVSDRDLLIRQAHLLAHEDSRQKEREAKRQERTDPASDRAVHAPAVISLHRNDDFFRYATDFLRDSHDYAMVTVVIDLNYFKLYNDIFGRAAGNHFLEAVSSALRVQADHLGGICGYLGGDNFILIFPDRPGELAARTVVDALYRNLPCPDGFSPAMGVYVSENPEEPVAAMYDHALTALQEIKGSYVEHYCFYDVDRFLRDRENKLLMMDIREGLDKNEFTFYLQPQVHEQTGRIAGAEALCRWIRNGRMIGPGQFIPTLEKTGTIYEVDRLIWEKVAAWMKSTKDRGLPQLPISVNVSRVDFFFTDVAQTFIDLAEKYGLDPENLGVEITESAFADNTELIMDAVSRLHAAGFRVLMDDFGSGYSSLSMLHTMSLDVLKTDVRFMSRKDADAKALSIVESVVSMAHMIGMLVVTEGIETASQRDSLIAMGDNYAQGFFFYHPMPVEQFEELLKDPDRIGTPFRQIREQVKNRLQFREMVNSGMLSESLLDNLIGPAAVFRRKQDALTLTQMNEQYRALSGIREDANGSDPILTENREVLRELLVQADRHPMEGTSGILRVTAEGRTMDLPIRIFLLYTYEDHTMYLMAMSA